MSVLIKVLKMPIDQPARIYLDPSGQCFIDHGHWFENCKAMELPAHGDLVDIDVLCSIKGGRTNGKMLFAELLKDAPVVIPAERSKNG